MGGDADRTDGRSVRAGIVDVLEEYPLIVVALAMGFMFRSRARSYERFLTNDGEPALAGIDPWYHWRTVQWTAEHYPHTMPFEVWTGFPTGRYVGQFGTLFDQIIVTVAMVAGLGDPSTETLYLVSLLIVPAMAALTAVPIYFVGRRLGGRLGGVVSVLLLALFSGEFFRRTTAGQLDHTAGEVLFMAVAVLALMVALGVAERHKPVYEQLLDRDWRGLRTPTLYAVAAGIALTCYIWVWPSGIVLIGIVGVFFGIHLVVDYVRGVSPDHVAFVGVVALGTAAVGTLALLEEPGTSITSFGYLQPITAALVAAGSVFLAALARGWDRRGIDRRLYPVAVAGLAAAGLAALAVVLPDVYETLVSNLTSRLLPIDPSTGTLTISEAQPPENFRQRSVEEFGTAFYTMFAGLALLLARPLTGRPYRAEYTLVIVWAAFLTSMAMTQVRFFYYFALPVAAGNAVLVADVARLVRVEFDADPRETLSSIETYQAIAVVLVVVLLFAPIALPLADTTAWEAGDHTGPHSDAMVWDGANEWLQGNSPEPGNYGGAGNADELEYYGVYDRPADGDFDYPEGAYGVMSWWDYGHLITVQGERIPHANPFQQNARSAAAFLTAQSERRGEAVLDGISAGEPVVDRPTEELESVEAGDEEMRYVMIDDEMAGGKFGPITRWAGPSYGSYFGQGEYTVDGEERLLAAPDDYYDTMLASLYLDDASGLEGYRLVYENNDYAVWSTAYEGSTYFDSERFDNLRLMDGTPLSGEWNAQTRSFYDRYATARVAGEPTNFGIESHVVSSVKTFERVEGATLTGSVDDAPANATAYATVELETGPGRNFTYTQQAEVENGSFELTVPYATTDELGTEDGYTNSNVEATGDYEVFVGTAGENGSVEQAYVGETAVPETAVVEGEGIDVELEAGGETVPDPTAETTADGEPVGVSVDDGNESGDGENDSADDTADLRLPARAR
ncbi:oligosaccharyl transferase, archaeosortase A system-associated [Saliphagus infecundisoli]|uniref:dolichyl-phosphooligosaccharide-protein glycotransferase n=1 Tax=Saliphagus infecundisoli TaxID=1849069 RepID=A0ABD5QG52_9EURY|nr:oligosaccharyl transferase, archaeosortase A system-associated [Saliphagus infecundisoli]